MSVDPGHAAYAGQSIYTRRGLRAYDAVVYGFNFPVLWRCPKARLVELYDAHVSARHLDIGVATGLLLDQCHFPSPAPTITLMDLNANSLAVAAQRLARYAPQTHQANVLEPWGLPRASFDSVGMFNLLHCLPGTLREKAVAFEYAGAALSPEGVLFGATLLGKGIEYTRLARRALAIMNRRGVMCNLDDRLEDLEAGLARVFASHEVRTVGSMVLFSAQTPV